MTVPSPRSLSRSSRRMVAGGGLVAAAALALAACGGSSSGSAPTTSAGGSASSTVKVGSSASSPPASAAYTVRTASVSGLGAVLVNGQGRTLYLLTSEKGGKLTCTDASGCTQVWPDTELPTGVLHGVTGGAAKASLLSTVKSPEGKLYLTYGTSKWPLYTFSGDSGPGQANGQGIKSFGGTWWAISPAGTAVTTQGSAATTSGGASSGGY